MVENCPFHNHDSLLGILRYKILPNEELIIDFLNELLQRPAERHISNRSPLAANETDNGGVVIAAACLFDTIISRCYYGI